MLLLSGGQESCLEISGERGSTLLACAKEMPVRGGLRATSQALCAVLTHLVQCVTGLLLAVAVNGSHLVRGLCYSSPPALRAAEDRNIFSGSSASLFKCPGKQWNQGYIHPRCTKGGSWKYCSEPPTSPVSYPLLVPTWDWEAASGLGTVTVGPACEVPSPGVPHGNRSCMCASSGGAAFSGCPAETLTDGPP